MFSFYIEFSIFLALLLSYLGMQKYKFFVVGTSGARLNTSRIILILTIFALLQISASFVELIKFISKFELVENFLFNYELSILPFAYFIYIAFIYFIVQGLVWFLTSKKAILTLHGWYKPLTIFVCTAYFSLFFIIEQLLKFLQFSSLILVILALSGLIILLTFNFIHIRKNFLKQNIEASYILIFSLSLVAITVLV